MTPIRLLLLLVLLALPSARAAAAMESTERLHRRRSRFGALAERKEVGFAINLPCSGLSGDRG